MNITVDQPDLTDKYRTLNLIAAEYTFFSNTQGTFSRIDHITDHKTSLNKFKNTEIIPSIFFNHNGMKLKMNSSWEIKNSQICGN